MVACTYNPSTQEVEAGGSWVRRPACTTWQGPVSKQIKTNKNHSHTFFLAVKKPTKARHWWLMPVISGGRDQEDRGSKPCSLCTGLGLPVHGLWQRLLDQLQGHELGSSCGSSAWSQHSMHQKISWKSPKDIACGIAAQPGAKETKGTEQKVGLDGAGLSPRVSYWPFLASRSWPSF
jgi:hypothetical protein